MNERPLERMHEPKAPIVYPNQGAKNKALEEAMAAFNYAQQSLANAARIDFEGAAESVNHQLEAAALMLSRVQQAHVGPTAVETPAPEPIIFLDPEAKEAILRRKRAILDGLRAGGADAATIASLEEDITAIEAWVIEPPFTYPTQKKKAEALVELRSKIENFERQVYVAERENAEAVPELRTQLFDLYRTRSRAERGIVEESDA